MTAPPSLAPHPTPAATPSSPPWHTLSAPACAQQLGVQAAPGLSHQEAALRLQRHGANKLAEAPPRPVWRGLLDQFKSMLIIILLVAAVIAGFIGDIKSVTVILVVVCFNAVLGFWQEYRAEQTLAALKKMLAPLARVRRNGRVEEIEASTLVPGDVVLLEAGDRVPADGRLLAEIGRAHV